MNDHQIRITLDEVLDRRKMTLTELAARTDISLVNLSILKTGKARAIRFTTLTKICQVLGCQPGDLLTYDGTTASQEAGENPAQ